MMVNMILEGWEYCTWIVNSVSVSNEYTVSVTSSSGPRVVYLTAHMTHKSGSLVCPRCVLSVWTASGEVKQLRGPWSLDTGDGVELLESG